MQSNTDYKRAGRKNIKPLSNIRAVQNALKFPTEVGNTKLGCNMEHTATMLERIMLCRQIMKRIKCSRCDFSQNCRRNAILIPLGNIDIRHSHRMCCAMVVGGVGVHRNHSECKSPRSPIRGSIIVS